MHNYQYIDNQHLLTIWSQNLTNQDQIAVDTEFTRRDTYYPQLNLLQIAANNLPTAVIDCQCNLDFSFILDRLANLSVIFHSGSQDQELFETVIGGRPKSYHDTQLLYSFTSSNNQISYQQLVGDQLDIKIDKAATQSDWSVRPLRPAQLHYAAEDVAHLVTLHQRLWDQLDTDKKRWYALACAEHYSEPTPAATIIANAWQKVAALHHLDDVDLAAGQHLAAWREQQAMILNVPKKWLFDDESLVALAKAREIVTSLSKQRHYKKLLQKNNLLEPLATAIDQAPQTPGQSRVRHQQLSNKEKAKVKTLKSAITRRCEARNISIGSVANRDDLIAATLGMPSRINLGWRAELLHDIDQLLPLN